MAQESRILWLTVHYSDDDECCPKGFVCFFTEKPQPFLSTIPTNSTRLLHYGKEA